MTFSRRHVLALKAAVDETFVLNDCLQARRYRPFPSCEMAERKREGFLCHDVTGNENGNPEEAIV